jgi:hypothetical protein
MKKFLTLFIVVLLAFSLVGCKKTIANVDTVENKVIITVTDQVEEDTNLFEFMGVLKDNNLLTYEYNTGAYGAYITSINGVQADFNQFWGLYSDDEEFTTTTDQIECNGKVYSQTILGAESLIVKQNKTYIWVLIEF